MRFLSPDFLLKLDPVKFFIMVALLFGTAFLLITPPFQGADETAHFLRAYQISEGHFVATRAADNRVGGYLPADVSTVLKITDTPAIQFYPQLKYGEGKTKQALEVHRTNKTSFEQFAASASYPPTAYPIPSVDILLTRLLSLPTIVALYAARLGNLLTWVVLMGAAIYLLPVRRWALVAVGLLPMALFQASTLNGDAMTIGSLALFLALILKIRNDATVISVRSLALLLLTATLMVLSKDIMFLFLPLVFLLRKENFRSSRHAWMVKAAVIVVPLLCFTIWIAASSATGGLQATGNNQNPTRQLHFILRNPHSYINVLWNTYFYTWGDGVTRSFIGTFGWADAPLSEALATIGYIGLFLLLVGSYEKNFKAVLSKQQKVFLAAIGFLYWLAVSTALYLYYSPVGFKIVYGLQGRYYIPLAIMAIPLLRYRKIIIEQVLYRRIAVYLPVFLLVASTITLYVRYFVNNV